MKLIKADHDRRIEIPGVAVPVPRPVDVDESQTGFANLRTLRIYQFDAGSMIDGHAEEDEVFVTVLAGTIELTVTGDNSINGPRHFTLAAANSLAGGNACVAYLPPHSAYRLISKTGAQVAYTRATPSGVRPAMVFTPSVMANSAGMRVLLEETAYAERLRCRLLEVNASQDEAAFSPLHEAEDMFEALIHVRIAPDETGAAIIGSDTGPIQLHSWDTVAIVPGDRPTLHFAKGSTATVLITFAKVPAAGQEK